MPRTTALTALLACVTTAVTAGGQASGSRSLNLGFETPSIVHATYPVAWDVPYAAPPGAVALDAAVAHSGRYSLRLRRLPGANGPVQAGLGIDVTPADRQKVVRFGMWMLFDSTSARPPVVRLIQYHGEDAVHRDSSVAPMAATQGWVKVDVEATLDSATDGFRMVVAQPGTGTTWVDDAEISIGGRAVTTDPKFDDTATPAELDWVRRNTRTLSGVSPGTPSRDLDAMRPLLASARIIGMGEAMHGSSEFRQFDARFVAWAVEELGVRLVLLEENALKADRLNAYVSSGRGDPREILQNAYDMWRNTETVALVEWIRRYNASGRGRVEIAGMDIIDGKPEADSVLSVLRRVDPAYATEVAPVYEQISRIWAEEIFPRGVYPNQRAVLDDSTQQRLERQTGTIAEQLRANRDRYGRLSDSATASWLVHNADAAHRNVAWMTMPRINDNTLFRDSVMALNVDWALARRPASTKAVILSHEGHVGRWEGDLGSRLAAEYGKAYRVVGMTEYAGFTGADTSAGRPITLRGFISMPLLPAPANSIAGLMHAAGVRYGWMDVASAAAEPMGRTLRDTLLFRYDAQQLNDFPFWDRRVLGWLDVLVYMDSSSMMHYLPCPQGRVCGG